MRSFRTPTSSQHKRGLSGGEPPSTSKQVVWLLVLAGILSVAALSTGVLSLSGLADSLVSVDPFNGSAAAPPLTPTDPLIVLSTGGGLWNTGVWAGWGMGDEVTLRWAAEGAKVTKTCPVRCEITKDQRRLPYADLVVMELVNHLKFLGEVCRRLLARANAFGAVMPS
jgi:hypothetical protein